MKCMDCGMEMEKGTVTCVGAGFESYYEFTSDKYKRKAAGGAKHRTKGSFFSFFSNDQVTETDIDVYAGYEGVTLCQQNKLHKIIL